MLLNINPNFIEINSIFHYDERNWINFDIEGEEINVGNTVFLMYLGVVLRVTTADRYYNSDNKKVGITIEGYIL